MNTLLNTVQTDNLVQTEYGIFREKDIPVLIPDSPQRSVILWLFACIIIFVIAYMVVVLTAVHEKKQLVRQRITLVKEFTNIDLELNNMVCRYIYIFGKNKINIRDLKINGVVPIRFESRYINKNENMLHLDLGQDISITSLSFASAEPIMRIFTRNESGLKVLDLF